MSWLRTQERMKGLSENSKRKTGWSRRKPDNRFKESVEQLEKSNKETDEAKSTSEEK